MQANQDHNWTDDAEFWDEAWADMNARLDDEPKRRKAAAPLWPFVLGLAAVFLLLVGVGVGILSDRENLPSSTAIAEAEREVQEEVRSATESTSPPVSKDYSTDEETEIVGNTMAKPDASRHSSENRQMTKVRNAKSTTSPEYGNSGPPSYVRTQIDSSTIQEDKTPEVASAALPTTSAATAENAAPRKNVKTAVRLLDEQLLRSLDNEPSYPLPSPTARKQRHRNPLSLEAAFTSDFTLRHPGHAIGLGYRINGGRRLTFPLHLAYRLDRSEIKDVSSEADLAVSAPSGPTAEDGFSPVSIGTESVELSAGLALTVTPRLRVSAGIGAAYQVRALISFERVPTTNLDGQFGNGSFDFFSLDLARSSPLISEYRNVTTTPDYRRWIWRAKLGLAYELSPRLGLNLRATHLLRQPDRERIIGLQSGRLEAGVSYRLR